MLKKVGGKGLLLLGVLALVCALVGALGGRFLPLGGSQNTGSVVVASAEHQGVGLRAEFRPTLDRAHPKLDTPLTRLTEIARVAPDQVAELARSQGVRLEPGAARVQAQLEVAPGAEEEVMLAVAVVGGEITGGYQNVLQGWLPPGQIASLADHTEIYRIQIPPQLFELEPWNQALTSVALPTVTSEGLVAMNGDAWQSGGHTGEGIRVAIIDGGFRGYTSLLGSELPSSVTVRNFVDGETDGDVGTGTSVHGTACAEIVHDVAPGAELYLVKVATDVDLAEAVNYVVAQGVDVISTSIGWSGVTPNDGTGFFADLVAWTHTEGTFWATAAGNYGETHWSGPFVDFGDGSHRFGPGQNLNTFSDEGSPSCYVIPSGYPINVVLQWDDWSLVDQDYDLYLYRWSGSNWDLVTGSTNSQTGGAGQRPVERIAIPAPGAGCYGVVIARYDATRDVHFDLFAYNMFGLNVREPARSLVNLADSPLAVTVGAVHYSWPHELEPFSSRGPTNGPGGVPTGGFTKPDLVAYDSVSTASYGSTNFPGTSASTPHVAGGAALIQAAAPDWGPDNIRQFLEEGALDQGVPGEDNNYGFGRLWLSNLVSIELVDWPTIVPANQPPTITWKVTVGGLGDTYVGWDLVPSLDSPPVYAHQSPVLYDASSGVYSNTQDIFAPSADRYYFRAFVEDASESLWTQERYVNVDPHEPEDDAWQTAFALDVPISGVTSYIRDAADIDWYTFEITRPGTVFTFTLTPPPGVDLDVVLFSPTVTPTLDEWKAIADGAALADIASTADRVAVADITTLADTAATIDLSAMGNALAIGAQPGATPEQVSHRVWSNAGPQRVMVFGYNGEFSDREPYRIDIAVDTSKAWDPTPVSLPDYRPPADPAVRTLFVTNWERLDSTYGVTASVEISTALNGIMSDPEVMGRVVDLSDLDTVDNTAIVSQAYTVWDDHAANPYLANNVSLVVQDVISDALGQYANAQYIVIIGDDVIVPFMRLSDRTTVGNERDYRDVSGAALTSPAYGALDGGLYLTDDCYADPDPVSWPGARLCVPDYPIGRLVENPDEIVAIIDVYRHQGGHLDPSDALVTGYDFLTDQAQVVSDTLGISWPTQVSVRPLIGDTWTAAELRQLWISGTYDLQSVNAHFDHFRVIAADKAADALWPAEIRGSNWEAVVGFSAGCHAGFSAHDPDFDEDSAMDFAQAMAGEGAIWIGNTGCGIGADSGVPYSEDLNVRFARRLVAGMQGSGLRVGEALMLAKQAYIAEAAPGSLGMYDLKALMQAALYGLPHWRVGGSGFLASQAIPSGGPQQSLVEPAVKPGITSLGDAAGAVTSRVITLTLHYDISAGTGGQVADVDIIALDDSLDLLTLSDVHTRQEVSFGRPQLPSLSFDAVYSASQVPRGVVILDGEANEYAFDPIVTRVITDHVYNLTEPVYAFQRWFPTQLVKVNRLGSHLGQQGNEGQLVLYPAHYRSTGSRMGILRAFETLRLRIYYEEVPTVDDWLAPVIRRVETLPTTDYVAIEVDVSDPDLDVGQSTGVAEVLLVYSVDGVIWQSDVSLTQEAGDIWHGTIYLPSGTRARNLSFVVQAIDGAGNVAYSSDKGRFYSGAAGALYLPLVRKSP